jgi:hypothetical protein
MNTQSTGRPAQGHTGYVDEINRAARADRPRSMATVQIEKSLAAAGEQGQPGGLGGALLAVTLWGLAPVATRALSVPGHLVDAVDHAGEVTQKLQQQRPDHLHARAVVDQHRDEREEEAQDDQRVPGSVHTCSWFR